MSIHRESDIEFDFSAAMSVVRHEDVNRVFPAVDFILEEATRDLWLEVKNWEGSSIEARRRGGQRWSFLCKMRGKPFFKEDLRAKFLGTVAYLSLTKNPPQREILYVALLESPKMDSALLLRADERLRNLLRPRHPWNPSIDAVVVNLNEWNHRFPEYPANAV